MMSVLMKAAKNQVVARFVRATLYGFSASLCLMGVMWWPLGIAGPQRTLDVLTTLPVVVFAVSLCGATLWQLLCALHATANYAEQAAKKRRKHS